MYIYVFWKKMCVQQWFIFFKTDTATGCCLLCVKIFTYMFLVRIKPFHARRYYVRFLNIKTNFESLRWTAQLKSRQMFVLPRGSPLFFSMCSSLWEKVRNNEKYSRNVFHKFLDVHLEKEWGTPRVLLLINAELKDLSKRNYLHIKASYTQQFARKH